MFEQHGEPIGPDVCALGKRKDLRVAADAVLEGKAMRKDEELEAETAQEMAAAEAKPARRAAREAMPEQDEEVGEDVLLGEATLAKLNVTRKPAEVETPEAAPETKEEAPASPQLPETPAEPSEN